MRLPLTPRRWIWTRVKDKTQLFQSLVLQSHPIQKKKKKKQQRGGRRGKGRKITAAKKKITNSMYSIHSKALLTLFILYTSLVIWRPNYRRLKTGNEKGETSQVLKRYLWNKDRIGKKKAKQQMSREKHLSKTNKNLKKFISLGSFSIGGVT